MTALGTGYTRGSLHAPRPAVDVNLSASVRGFVEAMRGLGEAFARIRPTMHLHFGNVPDERAEKRARKARSRALRMSLKAHRR